MEILNIENLTFKYPDCQTNAVENASLVVNEGEFVLLCGASGSGKTTLLRLLQPQTAPVGEKQGKVAFKDAVRAAIVSQDVETQIVSDTVWHNMAFALEGMNLPGNEIRQKIAETAEFFGIAHLFEKNTFQLSGGEKQLVNLASVMVTDPDVLILDEPTSQLDPIAAKNFTDMVKRLHSETNLTVIISEHCTENLWYYADKICVMHSGKITHFGTGRKVGRAIGNNRYVDLPTPVKLYNIFNIDCECPVNVKECRNYLSQHFFNKFDCIETRQCDNPVALECKNIYFKYEKNSPDVFTSLDFQCKFGEITTLLGGNGSGKTTLLGIISGIFKPYCGKVKKHGTKIAVLPQNVKTVFTKDVLKADLELVDKNFAYVTDSLDVTPLLNKNPYDLSGGEAQRAALAKVLLLKPDVLCLDEPTKGIDANGKSNIINILKSVAKQGTAVVIVSHDTDFAAQISDKCMFLFNGRIVSQGTPNEVFSKNKFYTTCASIVSRHMYKNAVTIENIVTLCKRNGQH